MGQDYYDDRDEYHTDDAVQTPRRADGRHGRKQAREAADTDRRDSQGSGKARAGHNWPPRSKYRIRPWS